MWISSTTHGDVYDNSGSPLSTSNFPDTHGNPFYIGYGEQANDYMDGEIEEVVWWKGYELSDSDASNLFSGSWR